MSFLSNRQTIPQKIMSLNWLLIALICCVASIGGLCLYSAAGGSFSPWASKHIIRFCVGLMIMIAIAIFDIRFWYKMAWPIYLLGFTLLIFVELKGHMGMGAERWINLGFMKLQPSEMMKIALVVILARWFAKASAHDMRDIKFLIPPLLLILLPVALVLRQPDLGTSLMMIMAGAGIFFIAGLSIWVFIGGGAITAAMIPVAWKFIKPYQKKRVMTFLDPESDPLGAGYHITQSKIALGSGGLKGKGFLGGTQSNLDFLPEKQTDFIFTLWAEEWGFSGGALLLLLFAFIFIYAIWLSMQIKHGFGRLLALGISINFSLYVFINIGMVMGLLPVVGAPLPLISYGGTSMLAVLIGFGLMMSAYLYRDERL